MTARNAAVAILLADLREELLVAPAEHVVDEHVRLMRFEEQVLAPASGTNAQVQSVRAQVQQRVRRAAAARPRRVAALIAAVCVISGSLGLNAAGALPGAVRHITEHITNSIVHTFGVPQAPHERAAVQPTSGSAPAVDGAQGLSAPATSSPATTSAPVATSTSSGSVPTPATAPSQPTVSAQSPPGGSTASDPPAPPVQQNMGRDPGAPAGFPADWQARAIAAARAQMESCTQADALSPAGCPQQAGTSGVNPTPGSVHWTLLNQPLAGATVIATMHETVGHRATTQVSVYGLFQMDVAYAVAGNDTHPYFAYSGGVAQATMTWDGSSYEGVSFTSGSATGQLPPGVNVPSFERPAVADSNVLAALRTGFEACAAPASAPDPSISNCPQGAALDPTATSAQWSLNGDPTQGAAVAFDSEHGNFTVTGTYAMTLSSVSAAGPSTVSVTGQYTATLTFDSEGLHLIAIASS
jgi:hypothetical protein